MCYIYLSLKKDVNLHLNKLESPWPNDALWQYSLVESQDETPPFGENQKAPFSHLSVTIQSTERWDFMLWIWPSGCEEQFKNVICLHADRHMDDRTDRQSGFLTCTIPYLLQFLHKQSIVSYTHSDQPIWTVAILCVQLPAFLTSLIEVRSFIRLEFPALLHELIHFLRTVRGSLQTLPLTQSFISFFGEITAQNGGLGMGKHLPDKNAVTPNVSFCCKLSVGNTFWWAPKWQILSNLCL